MKTTIFLTSAFCLLALGLFAQPGNPATPAPFAIELLIAGGAALGGRYYYKNQKQEK